MNSARRRSAAEASPTGERLLTATVELIELGGVQAATSRAITERAGENLGSITYHFGSKRDLVTHALISTARRLIAPVVATLAGDGDPARQLMTAVQQLAELADTSAHLLGAYSYALAEATHDPAIASALNELTSDIAAVLVNAIASQQSAGTLPATFDAPATAAMIIALVNGVAVTAARDPSINPAAIGAQFAQLLLTVSAGRSQLLEATEAEGVADHEHA